MTRRAASGRPIAAAAVTPSRPRGAARREALLEAVLQIVAEQGTDAVTHRRVAETAALPLASTTYYFESKEHLLTAALELAADRDITRLRATVADAPGATDPLELAVRAIVPDADATQAGRSSLITTYALLLEAARRPALRAIAQRWTGAYVEVIGRLLNAAGSSTPREHGELILAAADGLIIGQLASGETTDLTPRLHCLARALVGAS